MDRLMVTLPASEQCRPAWTRRFVDPTVMGRLAMSVLAVMVTLGSVGLWLVDGVSAEPESLLVIPVALCGLGYGLRGGAVAATIAMSMSVAWRLTDHGAIDIDFAAHSVTFGIVGLMVGWFVEQRRALVGVLERHQQLSLDLLAEASFDGYFTRVNPAWTHVLGYEPDELLSRPFLDFVHPDDRTATAAVSARQTSDGEGITRFQNRYRHRDGSYRWLEWSSRPDMKRQRLVAAARDVTDRKTHELAEQQYKQTLEQAVQERTQELDDSRLELLYRLALAAEYRDDQTFEHTNRVSHTSALLAGELGLDEGRISLLRQAALLHDIGKLGVSDTILLKPGKLTPEEWTIVQRHTVDGARILSGSRSDVLRMAEEIALSHHEWWDGSGYPHRLRGDAIPLTAQLVAIADVFDALTHERPYKPAWSVPQAVSEVQSLRGRQFAPTIVDTFNRLDPYRLAAGGGARPHDNPLGAATAPSTRAAPLHRRATTATLHAGGAATETGQADLQ